jgi:hypothetical protein
VVVSYRFTQPCPSPSSPDTGNGKEIYSENSSNRSTEILSLSYQSAYLLEGGYPTVSKENLIESAKLGRVTGHSREARTRQAEAQRRHAAANRAWQASRPPIWLDKDCYLRKTQPLLEGITVPVLASALGISEPYAAEIRAGRYLPHPRHWQNLAWLVGVAPDE